MWFIRVTVSLDVMHKIEHLKFDNLKLADVRPGFDETGMHFASLRYPTRQLQLYLHGHVVEAPQQAPVEYGAGWSFWFKPSSEDVPNLEKMEELLTTPTGAQLLEGMEADLTKYELRETLNDNSHVRIKLKRDEDGWKFTSNARITEDTMAADLQKGTPVTVTVAPGFYFSDENNRYGLYLTLKELKFSEAVEAPMRLKGKAPMAKRAPAVKVR